MEKIKSYIFEKLSSENIKELKKYIDDDNFHKVLPKVIKAAKEADLIGENFKTFFTQKGLANIHYDGNHEAEIGMRIASYFAEADKNDILKEIVKNGGKISLDELLSGNNIYDFCNDFKDVAEKISAIKNVTANNSNVGKFEILIKFLLKENHVEHNNGDITVFYIKDNGKKFGIEVKGGNDASSSAHICNQNFKGIIETTEYFCKLLNIKTSDTSFMGSAVSNKRMSSILNDNEINDITVVIDAYIRAIAFQYYIEDEETITDCITKFNEFNEKNKIFTIKDNKINILKLNDVLGFIQLYFYCKSSKWDALITINQENGHYQIILKDNILDFELIKSKVIFTPSRGSIKTKANRESISTIFPR